jgi:aminopeptidase N
MKQALIFLLLNLFFMSGIQHVALANDIDTRHIVLNLKFDWQKQQASGTATISLSTSRKTDTIHLDAGFLTIHAITLGGQNLLFHYDGKDKKNGLAIILDKVHEPNEVFQLAISYTTNYVNESDPNNLGGSFGKGLRFMQPTATTPAKHKQIWSQGEPDNNRYWFPCNDTLADIHTTEVIATVEKPLIAMSNGHLVAQRDNDDGTQTFHYKADTPYPNYLTCLVVGEYTDVVQQSKTTAIHTLAYPHERVAAQATTALLPDMMQYLEKLTGHAYPYHHYTQVMVQDYPFPGLNGQHTISTISDNYIDDYGVHHDFKYLWDGIALQSLAAQWFGNLIMIQDWGHVWLNCAFTQYFAGLYTMHDNGKAEYLTYYNPFENANVAADWAAGYKHPLVVTNVADISAFTADSYAKYRGALVLRMLAQELGDRLWWASIKHYVKTNAGKQVTTSDFQKAIERTTGKSYQWFFDQWVYKVGMPKFELSKQYDASKKELTIHLRQVQVRDTACQYPQVDFFEGHVQLEIDGDIETVYITPAAQNTFVFTKRSSPSFVHFDFENIWIKVAVYLKTTDELIAQLNHSKDALAKQVAIDELDKAYKTTTSTNEKQKIQQVFKQVITSHEYWRLRQYALTKYRNTLASGYDSASIDMLLHVIKTETSWLKASAILTLGNTKDPKYDAVYLDAMNDPSDRVVNAAAIALGKSKSTKAYNALLALDQKPSWKNQSRISALNGLKELGDDRAIDYALSCLKDNTSPRWYLATSVWDYPLAAAETLAKFKKGALAYPAILSRFRQSMLELDVNDIFSNLLLIATLGDPRGKEVFDELKARFKEDTNAMNAITQYENQLTESIKTQ